MSSSLSKGIRAGLEFGHELNLIRVQIKDMISVKWTQIKLIHFHLGTLYKLRDIISVKWTRIKLIHVHLGTLYKLMDMILVR